MKPVAIAAIALMLPCAGIAATRNYDVSPFESVSAAQGIDVVITVGTTRSVAAESRGKDFDELRIAVERNVLHIDRPSRNWLSFWRRPNYTVRVVTPVLRSLTASSGSDVTVNGELQGDLEVNASSGSDVSVASIKGGHVSARASAGSDVRIAGSCVRLNIDASSGSDVDAQDLQCESVAVNASRQRCVLESVEDRHRQRVERLRHQDTRRGVGTGGEIIWSRCDNQEVTGPQTRTTCPSPLTSLAERPR